MYKHGVDAHTTLRREYEKLLTLFATIRDKQPTIVVEKDLISTSDYVLTESEYKAYKEAEDKYLDSKRGQYSHSESFINLVKKKPSELLIYCRALLNYIAAVKIDNVNDWKTCLVEAQITTIQGKDTFVAEMRRQLDDLEVIIQPEQPTPQPSKLIALLHWNNKNLAFTLPFLLLAITVALTIPYTLPAILASALTCVAVVAFIAQVDRVRHFVENNKTLLGGIMLAMIAAIAAPILIPGMAAKFLSLASWLPSSLTAATSGASFLPEAVTAAYLTLVTAAGAVAIFFTSIRSCFYSKTVKTVMPKDSSANYDDIKRSGGGYFTRSASLPAMQEIPKNLDNNLHDNIISSTPASTSTPRTSAHTIIITHPVPPSLDNPLLSGLPQTIRSTSGTLVIPSPVSNSSPLNNQGEEQSPLDKKSNESVETTSNASSRPASPKASKTPLTSSLSGSGAAFSAPFREQAQDAGASSTDKVHSDAVLNMV